MDSKTLCSFIERFFWTIYGIVSAILAINYLGAIVHSEFFGNMHSSNDIMGPHW